MVRVTEPVDGRVRRATSLAVWALAVCLSAPVAAEPGRTIIYANVGGERVQRAFEQLRSALQRAGIFARFGVELRHEVVHEQQLDVLRSDMARIVALRPAAIVAPGVVIAAAAQAATAGTPIPVVFGSWESPVQAGLVESLARPGGNLTGFTVFLPLDEKRLELLKDLAPKARRLGVVVDKLWAQQPQAVRSLEAAARRFDLTVETFAVENEGELQAALESARGRKMHAWYVPLVEVLFRNPDFVVDAFRRSGKPAMYTRSLYVEKGGLIAYHSDLGDVFELWAKLLGQILAGVPPAIIPIEGPRHFELAINLEAARELGVTIPRSLLRRADRFY